MKLTKKITKITKVWRRKITSFFWFRDCAGGIYIRERKGKKEILCILHKDGGIMLPKGGIKKGESLRDAAVREFQEETGIQHSVVVSEIGIVSDSIRRKKIVFFLMQTQESSPTTLRDEAIMWVELEKSPKKMKHKSEGEFIEKFLL